VQAQDKFRWQENCPSAVAPFSRQQLPNWGILMETATSAMVLMGILFHSDRFVNSFLSLPWVEAVVFTGRDTF